MDALTAAVALVGILCLCDLLLSLGTIRRLREHTELIAKSAKPDHGDVGIPVGRMPARFSAIGTVGAVQGPAGLRVIAFFSTRCPICPVRLPGFVDYVTRTATEVADALAVIVGDDADAWPHLSRLEGTANVVNEGFGGALSQAFEVAMFPAFFVLDASGAVVSSGYESTVLPAPVPA